MTAIKKYMIVLGSFLMFSCGPNVVPNADSIPTPPAKTESVKPSLEKVKDGVSNSILENSKVAEKVNNQNKSLVEQKNTIELALIEAKKLEEKLKTKQSINESELLSLKLKIEQIKKENAKLIETNQGMSENVRYLMDVLNSVRKDASVVTNKLNDAENELNVLRDQNKTISKNLESRNKDVEIMQKQVIKSEKAESAAKVWRNAFWILIGGFGLWTVVKNLIMIYYPTVKFRI